MATAACRLKASAGSWGLRPPIFPGFLPNTSRRDFSDYLNRYRLEQAKLLLIETGETVGDIGLRVGFNSPQSFIRVFKRYEGETPGQFRTRMKGEEQREDER